MSLRPMVWTILEVESSVKARANGAGAGVIDDCIRVGEAMQEKLREMSALFEVSAVLTSTLDLAEVLGFDAPSG